MDPLRAARIKKFIALAEKEGFNREQIIKFLERKGFSKEEIRIVLAERYSKANSLTPYLKNHIGEQILLTRKKNAPSDQNKPQFKEILINKKKKISLFLITLLILFCFFFFLLTSGQQSSTKVFRSNENAASSYASSLFDTYFSNSSVVSTIVDCINRPGINFVNDKNCVFSRLNLSNTSLSQRQRMLTKYVRYCDFTFDEINKHFHKNLNNSLAGLDWCYAQGVITLNISNISLMKTIIKNPDYQNYVMAGIFLNETYCTYIKIAPLRNFCYSALS